jgi:hypothetical protein
VLVIVEYMSELLLETPSTESVGVDTVGSDVRILEISSLEMGLSAGNESPESESPATPTELEGSESDKVEIMSEALRSEEICAFSKSILLETVEG